MGLALAYIVFIILLIPAIIILLTGFGFFIAGFILSAFERRKKMAVVFLIIGIIEMVVSTPIVWFLISCIRDLNAII